jgi:hypothetical protein
MPAQRIGVRISPFARDNNASDPGTAATYTYGNLEKPPQFWHDVDEPILT